MSGASLLRECPPWHLASFRCGAKVRTLLAQQPAKLPIIGFIGAGTPSTYSRWVAAFVQRFLEIRGIYHGEASYEGRVFLNNPKADQNTPRTLENGYAGAFHIFGHGGCFGDAGHCVVNDHEREHYDWRPPHPLTPAVKRVSVTNALREIAKTTNEITVTIVPVVNTANELCNTTDVFRCEEMRFLTIIHN